MIEWFVDASEDGVGCLAAAAEEPEPFSLLAVAACCCPAGHKVDPALRSAVLCRLLLLLVPGCRSLPRGSRLRRRVTQQHVDARVLHERQEDKPDATKRHLY